MAELVKTVEFLEESLNRSLVNLKKTPKTRINKCYLDTKLELAKELWSRYTTAVTEAVGQIPVETVDGIRSLQPEAVDKVEEVFIEIVQWINSHLPERNESNSNSSQNNSSTSQSDSSKGTKGVLKSITLPKFNGDFMSWLTFHDMFVSLVHNDKGLTKVQKLQYLKAATEESSEPNRLLSPYAITEANYDDAWGLMLRVYNNKRLLVGGQLDILFSLESVSTESANELKSLIYGTDQALKSLKNLGIEIGNWDCFVVHMTARRLPSVTRNLWEHEVTGSAELPTFEELLKFVEKRYRSLMTTEPVHSVTGSASNSDENKRLATSGFKSGTNSKSKGTGCVKCQGNHDLERCSNFISLSLNDRWNSVKRLGVCFRCLKKGHKTVSCKSSVKCMYCVKAHHTLLHDCSNQASTDPKSTKKAMHTEVENGKEKVFATALVNLRDKNGDMHTLRALLDPTSNSCFITAKACRLLECHVVNNQRALTGLGDKDLGLSSGSVTFGISSIYNSDKICDVTALVVQSVSSKQPSQKLEKCENWESFKELQLADPMFNVPGEVDMLLDVEVFSLIIKSGLIKTLNYPNVHETSLGWIVLGVISKTSNMKPLDVKASRVFLTNKSLDTQLQKFWEQEERVFEKTQTSDEVFCEKLFKETTCRKKDGRYVVHLPMKEKDGYCLGKSRHKAYSRFASLENKLNRDPKLREKYRNCLEEYFELDQIENCDETDEESYYIPHHAVVKAEKFRVVFDASCETDSGYSLNDCMHAGPKLQTELWVVMNNWRRYRYAFQSDIEKMYRQVEVSREDANRQRILWRRTEEGPIETFRLNRLTFGVKASPFLAVRTLHQLADEERDKFPKAQYAVKNEFYMDDLRSGEDTIEEAVELRNQIEEMLERGKFPLRKWSANDSRILEGVPPEFLESLNRLEISEEGSGITVKSLGLLWNPKEDVFHFDIKEVTPLTKFTKRNLLSRIAMLYDPMGWISPMIVKAKILMQSLWKLNCDWDEQVPDEVKREWESIESSLVKLRVITVPRWIGLLKTIDSYQIHAFCDASVKAYAAVIYIRVVNVDGQISVCLLSSKTKVAPLKTVTLPKLELCGAVLAAELSCSIIDSLKLDPEKIHCWSDSEISLAWISKSPHNWTTYVANRVALVQSRTPMKSWSYVKSKENPADCASRGISTQELVNHNLWWTGPQWLIKSEREWPQNQEKFETVLEVRKKMVLLTKHTNSTGFVERFSSLRRATRVLARIRTWRIPKNLREGRLSVSDLKHSVIVLVKSVQKDNFKREIELLENSKELRLEGNVCRSLAKLNPFLDSHGVLRVGGRIRQSQLSYNKKHPIVLPKDSHFTRLVIRDGHEATLHGSIQEVLSYVRHLYSIIGDRNTIQQVLTSCVNCNRVKARLCTQIMADLPLTRISNEGQTFVHTGLDYAGPFYYRTSRLRNAKRLNCYVALFVCFSTKAVNLQVVSDKSVEGFMKAYIRFTSLRGKPSVMYSDNEGAFVKADRLMQGEVREIFRAIHEEAKDILINEGVTWLFNPPEAPHQGGLWEANIKSMKRHLFASIGNSSLTFEELTTVLAKVEACLNSRPLCALSEDPDDFEVLTAGHFLIGRTLMSVPETSYLDLKDHVLSRWKYLQKLSQTFWSRWSEEYLVTLQMRNKWVHKGRQLQVNDLVLLKEELTKPLQWRRGRVIETMKGKDFNCRVVKVKTMTGIVTRDIRKICLLLPSQTSETRA